MITLENGRYKINLTTRQVPPPNISTGASYIDKKEFSNYIEAQKIIRQIINK